MICNGGGRMPSFPAIQDGTLNSLIDYLDHKAAPGVGIPKIQIQPIEADHDLSAEMDMIGSMIRKATRQLRLPGER